MKQKQNIEYSMQKSAKTAHCFSLAELFCILISVFCMLLFFGCGGGSSSPPANGTLMVSAQNSSGGSVSAKILLNNEAKGNAPLQITDLAPATYTLLLQSAGYTDYTSSVVVQSGQTTTVTAAMQTVSVPDGPTFTKQ